MRIKNEYILFFICCISLCCRTNDQLEIINYRDYLNEKNLFNKLTYDLDCKQKIKIIKQFKSIDIRQNSKQLVKSCDYDLKLNIGSKDSLIVSNFEDILNNDQYVRNQYNEYIRNRQDLIFDGANFEHISKERKRAWDSIIGKVDSINRGKFSKIVNKIGEWLCSCLKTYG